MKTAVITFYLSIKLTPQRTGKLWPLITTSLVIFFLLWSVSLQDQHIQTYWFILNIFKKKKAIFIAWLKWQINALLVRQKKISYFWNLWVNVMSWKHQHVKKQCMDIFTDISCLKQHVCALTHTHTPFIMFYRSLNPILQIFHILFLCSSFAHCSSCTVFNLPL